MRKSPLKRVNSLKSGGGLSRTSSSLKKSSNLKSNGRIKVKPKTEEQKKSDQEQWEKDKAFYIHIWETRLHVCSSCDMPIYGELRTTYIEHILEKGIDKYAHLRYCEDNIRIICQNCHSLKTNGFPTEKYQKIIDETLTKFKNGELCVKEQ